MSKSIRSLTRHSSASGLIVLGLVSSVCANAQVSFAGVQSTVGSGLTNPVAVAVDGAGNVFIVDNGNNRVVKVSATGGAQTAVPFHKFIDSVAIATLGIAARKTVNDGVLRNFQVR